MEGKDRRRVGEREGGREMMGERMEEWEGGWTDGQMERKKAG